MKPIKIISYVIEGIFCTIQICLWGEPSFSLPQDTPGKQFMQENYNEKWYEHVIIPDTDCNLYFPIDGTQPNTPDAGYSSGARYFGRNNDAVTYWWIRVFGGNQAVKLSNASINNTLYDPLMGYGKAGKETHIIQAEGTLSFQWQFWQAFRCIAEDPVGRVLLYRLLIEIRRIDSITKTGCCENQVTITSVNLKARNACRSLTIRYCKDGSSFSFHHADIELNTAITQHRVLKQNGKFLTTDLDNRTCDVSLFHEMLHWLHHLQNEDRIVSGKEKYKFPCMARFYYGNLTELTLWGLYFEDIDEEEIATILGVPDYNNLEYQNLMPQIIFPLNNDGISFQVQINGQWQYIPIYGKYLNGYDLSENAYRCSKTESGRTHAYMRFGHSTSKILDLVPVNNRLKLAHKVAMDCYLKIMNNEDVTKWNLKSREAIKP